jgi:hypothetical protein
MIGRYAGALSAVRADDLAAVPLCALVKRNPGLDPAAMGGRLAAVLGALQG